MTKILKILKAFVVTSTVSLSLVACRGERNQVYVDISNITMEMINAKVSLNNGEIYNTALHQFQINIENKINSLITQGREAKYYVDFKIKIANHGIYDKIKKLELLDINVSATSDSKVLKGNFKAEVNLVPKAVDISNINIDKQETKIVVNTTTFEQAINGQCLSLIQNKITNLVATARQDNDYVVNVEGHQLTEQIAKLEPVHINVNAVEDDYHFLLQGSFTFILVLVAV
ncbi:hypothetical protein [Spiroplasma endosymbiont of Polydrusus pterygomalis]|uniref:hypothetical protein n=1 Tax=Spiroplasma endosymbiont of Polydrusus pterygomalis TaxID=3139327 RepID=UPI003CCB1265